MNYLLWSDPHFTDSPLEAYRWDVFKSLKEIAIKYRVNKIICLGDLVDRKDRHTGALINHIVEELADLHFETNAPIDILAGNHDKPLTGPYFWKFINRQKNLRYLEQWEWQEEGVLYLPYAANPIEDWPQLDKVKLVAMFMHQTMEGALVEDDFKLKGNKLPVLPLLPIFSGDVHRPQFIKGVTYIGACHPVKFGESWPNRVIIIQNDDFVNFIEVPLPTIKRDVIDISLSDELFKLDYHKSDQLRIRYHLTAEKMIIWPVEEEIIRKWADTNGIFLASIEAKLVSNTLEAKSEEEVRTLEIMPPEEVIKVFGVTEKLDQNVIEIGLELLKESK